ncbi:hypothetical protein AX17_002583 [Amanita inopinata Kibby_2008]|nr:hypothetical protein AX17_002583 [Amanita inopinata Kibby_2008]
MSITPDAEKKDLPPPRESKPLKDVSPPLSGMRLHHLIYSLLLLSSIIGAYYSYRLIQYKTQVGGWWNMAIGRSPSHLQQQQQSARPCSCTHGKSGQRDMVEDRLSRLAQALGMPTDDLAGAIAGAVREYVPPASLSSIAATETGRAVRILLEGAGERGGGKASQGAASVVEGVKTGMGKFVGMDEP